MNEYWTKILTFITGKSEQKKQEKRQNSYGINWAVVHCEYQLLN